MEENPNPEVLDNTPKSDNHIADKSNKRKDFWLGLIGSIVGNLLLVGLYILIMNLANGPTQREGTTLILWNVASSIVGLLPWVLNIGAIIVSLVVQRNGIALGILASYGAALALAVVAGIVFTIVCFSQGGY